MVTLCRSVYAIRCHSIILSHRGRAMRVSLQPLAVHGHAPSRRWTVRRCSNIQTSYLLGTFKISVDLARRAALPYIYIYLCELVGCLYSISVQNIKERNTQKMLYLSLYYFRIELLDKTLISKGELQFQGYVLNLQRLL